jgi:hypothetical protein
MYVTVSCYVMYWVSHFFLIWWVFGSQGNVVCIATRCWLDDPGFEPWWGQGSFCSLYPSRLVLAFTEPPLQWMLWLFLGDNVAGVWHWPCTLSGTDVKEWVQLYPLIPLFAFCGILWGDLYILVGLWSVITGAGLLRLYFLDLWFFVQSCDL